MYSSLLSGISNTALLSRSQMMRLKLIPAVRAVIPEMTPRTKDSCFWLNPLSCAVIAIKAANIDITAITLAEIVTRLVRLRLVIAISSVSKDSNNGADSKAYRAHGLRYIPSKATTYECSGISDN